MSKTDDSNLPGRTILSIEGSVNRITHLLKTDGNYKMLTTVEAKRFNGFPDIWTDTDVRNNEIFLHGEMLWWFL